VRAAGLLPCLQPSIACAIAAPDARLTGKSNNLPSWVLPINLSATRHAKCGTPGPAQNRHVKVGPPWFLHSPQLRD